MLKRLPFFLVVIILISAGGYYAWGRLQQTTKIDPPQLVAVKRGMFVHEILARGSVDSAKNEEIRCRVESAGQDGLVITYVIPEGTFVKKDDLLIELESARLQENTERQLVTVINSQTALDQAEEDLKIATLELTEYLEGTFELRHKTLENAIYTAEELVRQQEDQLVHYQRLYERGYITYAQVEAALIELSKSEKSHEAAKLELKNLEDFTKKKLVTQYDAAIANAKGQVAAKKQTLEIDTSRLAHLKKQLDNCRILAPADGQVVYFMPRWGGDENLVREGKKVIDKEVLLHLPDPTQMQVKGLVNEANVWKVRPGQKATIRLEAFLNETFEGEVMIVNPLPEPVGWQGGTMSREYLTTIKILNPPEGIRTGLTAEARIIVNEIYDALLLPAPSVFTHGRKTYAVTFKDGEWDKVEIKVGPSNDKEVVILEGLNEGDIVVLGGWVHRDKLDLPDIVEESSRESDPAEEEQLREQMRQEEMLLQQQPQGSPGGQPRERPAGGGERRQGGGPPSGGGGPRP